MLPVFHFLNSATSFHPCRLKCLFLPSVLRHSLLLPRARQPCLLVSVQLELHNLFFRIVALTVLFLSLHLSHDSNILDKSACCQLKDFHGLRSSQFFPLSFNSDTSLHCPLVKLSNSCIHVFCYNAYHALE